MNFKWKQALLPCKDSWQLSCLGGGMGNGGHKESDRNGSWDSNVPFSQRNLNKRLFPGLSFDSTVASELLAQEWLEKRCTCHVTVPQVWTHAAGPFFLLTYYLFFNSLILHVFSFLCQEIHCKLAGGWGWGRWNDNIKHQSNSE